MPTGNVTLQRLYDRIVAHEQRDDDRFDEIHSFIKEIKYFTRWAVLGLVGTVALAILNLVVHH